MRILVIGSTNFVGRAIVRHLVQAGHQVRALIPPGPQSPMLPQGVSVEAVLTAPHDPKGLRAALVGIEAVISADGAAMPAQGEDLLTLVRQAQTLSEAAREAHIAHILHLSTLGAEPASAYPWFKAHGLAEIAFQRAQVPYTIFRLGIPFGPDDDFTNTLALLLHATPFFPLPNHGRTLLQPLWVEDLAAALTLALETLAPQGQTIPLGGGEHLSLQEISQTVAAALGLKRRFWGLSPAHLRHLTVWLRYLFPRLPVSSLWLDYFAADRIAATDTLPREFGLLPERFAHHLDYLKTIPWRRRLLHTLFAR